MFFSVSRLEHGEKCHLMKVVKKIPTSPQNRDRPALPYTLKLLKIIIIIMHSDIPAIFVSDNQY